MRTKWPAISGLAVILILTACGGSGAPLKTGTWRGTLESPGGDLSFLMTLQRENGELTATVHNGREEVPVPVVSRDRDTITLGFEHYDSRITASVLHDGGRMTGDWRLQRGLEVQTMRFRARHLEEGETPPLRFETPGERPADRKGSPDDIAGEWACTFTDPEEVFPALGRFAWTGSAIEGTFLTPTGDYRYLAGDYRDGLLRLSTFDGAHAFLSIARAGDDGSLTGDFWSRGTYHATWTAQRRIKDQAVLPDPYEETVLTNPTGRFRFSFPDLDGNMVSHDDPRFLGKVVLAEIFGSWCPNCNDEASLLVELHERFHERGLEIVGLAYEMTGDFDRDASFVRRYRERHQVPWTLLVAGTWQKPEASETIPDLSGVLSFPTLIFIGRDGTVKAIHTGFQGPGTGYDYEALKAGYVAQIESQLDGSSVTAD